MKVAVTGATGFIGHYIVRHLIEQGHSCRCWYRPESIRRTLEDVSDGIEWIEGDLANTDSAAALVKGCDAVVHAALDRPGEAFRGAEGDIVAFADRNIVGSLRLIAQAHVADVPRFVFISTCAVHEIILEDRKLDEAHPMWPRSHYGAYKAAVEEFVYSYGYRYNYDICALRPTGVYGLHHMPASSKWYDLVKSVAEGKTDRVTPQGGKEVHAADVARAVGVLLKADGVAGQAYNCYDRYIAQEEVAEIAARLSGRDVTIARTNPGPKHQIDTSKIRKLGMSFGGEALLETTVGELLNS
jgi:nucleoside-diphosphate-sugar epimerase